MDLPTRDTLVQHAKVINDHTAQMKFIGDMNKANYVSISEIWERLERLEKHVFPEVSSTS